MRNYCIFMCFAGAVFASAAGCSRDKIVWSTNADTDTASATDGTDSTVDSETGLSTDPVDPWCETAEEVPLTGDGPADLIMVLDNAASMGEERDQVQSYLSLMATQVHSDGIDLQVIALTCGTDACLQDQLGDPDGAAFCAVPPLGAASCPDDSNPPGYTHLDVSAQNTRTLETVITSFSAYGELLRPDARKHFLVVSDNRDDMTAREFQDALASLPDEPFGEYQFHGIFSFYSREDACLLDDSHPCCLHAAVQGEGETYKDLVLTTGGISDDLCDQDFSSAFDELARRIVDRAPMGCVWDVPPVPGDHPFSPDLVNLVYGNGIGTQKIIGHVTSQLQCVDVEDAWYYSDSSTSDRIVLCPQTCEWVQSGINSTLRVEFGCETQLSPLARQRR